MAGNMGAWFGTVSLAVAYIGFCSVVGKLKLLPSKLSRKLMHMGKSGKGTDLQT